MSDNAMVTAALSHPGCCPLHWARSAFSARRVGFVRATEALQRIQGVCTLAKNGNAAIGKVHWSTKLGYAVFSS